MANGADVTAKSRPGRKISNSTFWLLILVGLLPSLIAALVNIQSQRLLLARAADILQSSADHLSKSFSKRLEAATFELHILASKPVLADSQASIDEKLSLLRLTQANSDTFEDFFVLDTDGRVLFSTASQPVQLALQMDLRQAVAGNKGAVKLPEANLEGLLLSSAIGNKLGDNSPILLGFARLDKLAFEIEKFALGYSGFAVLTNDEESILVCNNPSLVGQHFSMALGNTVERQDISRLTDGLLGTIGNYCLAAHTLPHSVLPAGNSWQVLVAQTRAEILESASSPARWSLLTVIVIVPIVLILGLLFTNSVRRSLNFLITATRKIANGDFTNQPIDRSYWEIDELARSFEEMKNILAKSRQQLLQYQMGLEDLVAQRAEQLRESEHKYRTLYESSHDALMLMTPQLGFLNGNPAAVKMFGCQGEAEFSSNTMVSFSPERQPDGTLSSEKIQQMIATVINKGSHFFDWMCKRLDGTEFCATVLLTRMNLNGETVLQATVRDVTEHKRLQDVLVGRAQIDPLTELWNRRALMTRLNQEWSRRERYGGQLALIMADIDHFKPLNDTHGHQLGDEILRRVAEVFLNQCRESDFPTRYGGEEFAIVVSNADVQEAANLAQRCRQAIEAIVLDIDGHRLEVTASFGVADASGLASVEDLIKQSDATLYQAKRAGRNRVELTGHTQSTTTIGHISNR